MNKSSSLGFQAYCLECEIKELKDREDVYLLNIARELILKVVNTMEKEER